ncbi:MAG: CDP-alcohol phosphatidyltransferase family protein [Bacteroidota bacterium]
MAVSPKEKNRILQTDDYMRQLPNILTLGNLFCGMLMILTVILGAVEYTMIIMGIAFILDVMDGRLAYWLKVQSELGKQLDSLADMVSFGVVPGLMMARMIAEGMEVPFPPSSMEEAFAFPLYLGGFLLPVFAALRLAKFNLEGNQDRFEGVPTPAMTLVVSGLWYGLSVEGGLRASSSASMFMTPTLLPYILLAITLILCVLMVARLPMLNLKFKGWGWNANRFRYLLLISSVILVVIFGWLIFPVVFLLYLGLSAWAFFAEA